MRKRLTGGPAPLEQVAGNGLLHRRALLGRRHRVRRRHDAPAPLPQRRRRAADQIPLEPRCPATSRRSCRQPSRFEENVVRILSNPKGEPRTQHARAPLQMLDGTITPNPLHFTILHSGIPDIDPGAAPPRHPRHGEAAARIHASTSCCATRWSRASTSSNAAATAPPCSPTSRCRRPCSSCTASPPAPNGPACRSRSCSTRPASIRKRSGSWPKAPTTFWSTAACR